MRYPEPVARSADALAACTAEGGFCSKIKTPPEEANRSRRSQDVGRRAARRLPSQHPKRGVNGCRQRYRMAKRCDKSRSLKLQFLYFIGTEIFKTEKLK